MNGLFADVRSQIVKRCIQFANSVWLNLPMLLGMLHRWSCCHFRIYQHKNFLGLFYSELSLFHLIFQVVKLFFSLFVSGSNSGGSSNGWRFAVTQIHRWMTRVFVAAEQIHSSTFSLQTATFNSDVKQRRSTATLCRNKCSSSRNIRNDRIELLQWWDWIYFGRRARSKLAW